MEKWKNMRKLWDNTNTEQPIQTYNSETEAELERQVNELRGIVTTFTNLVNDTVAALEQYKEDQAASISTQNLATVNATIEALEALNIKVNDIDITDATVDQLQAEQANIKTLYSDLANIVSLQVDNVEVNTKLDAETIEAKTAVIDALTVNDLTVSGLYEFATITATNANIGTANVDTVNATSATINELNAPEASITNLVSNNIEAVSESIQNSKIDTLDVEQITHKLHYIQPENEVQYIIAPPYFRNGQYRLIALNANNEACVALDIRNDVSNIWLSWSRRPSIGHYIEECRIFDYNSQRPQIYIKVNEANNVKLTWYYEYQGYDELANAAPSTWPDYPFNISLPGSWLYKFIHNEGVYFSHAVDIITNEGEHDYASLVLTPTSQWQESSWTAIEYNGLQDKDFKVYRPNQDVSTDADVTFHTISIEGLEQKYVVTIDGQFSSMNPSQVVNGILNPEFKPVEGASLATWNGSTSARTANTTEYTNAMVVAGVVYEATDAEGLHFEKVDITPDALTHGTLVSFTDRVVLRKHDRADYYVSAPGVDVTPAGIDSYKLYRYSIVDLNAYVDYKVSDGIWERLEEFIPNTYVIDTNPFNVQPQHGPWSAVVYSYDDTTLTKPITKLGLVDDVDGIDDDTADVNVNDITSASTTSEDIKATNSLETEGSVVLSAHQFIGTQAQFTAAVAANKIANDCLVMITE